MGHKLASNQKKVVNGFIHFKLIIWNIIKKQAAFSLKIKYQYLIFDGVLIPNFLNNLFAHLIFNEPWPFPITNSIIWYKHYFILFSYSDTIIVVWSVYLTTEGILFHCFYIVYFTAFIGYLISYFNSSYSLSTIFTEMNSSWWIRESIKALENKTLMVFNNATVYYHGFSSFS